MSSFEALLWRIIDRALELLAILHPPRASFNFGVGPVTLKNQVTTSMPLDVTITNEQQVVVTLHPVTSGGHPAAVDGAPTWEVIPGGGTSTVVPATDGLSATLISSDDPGDTQFMVSADVDPGPNVQSISDIVTLHVNHALAANLGITAADPTPKA